MRCPTCDDVQLVMTDRQGIEIDYCPQCRGVWLDRGELDKIIERSGRSDAGHDRGPAPAPRRDDRYDDDDDSHKHHHKRKKSWLSELFD